MISRDLKQADIQSYYEAMEIIHLHTPRLSWPPESPTILQVVQKACHSLMHMNRQFVV